MIKLDYDMKLERLQDVYDIINGNLVKSSIDYFPHYRGQSNHQWILSPSILRTNNKEPNTDSSNLFDYIARRQHYGTPTRFLDYTLDPKVALYFACCDNINYDGKLFITCYDSIDENSDYTKIICKLTQLEKEITLEKFANDISTEIAIPQEEIISKVKAFLDYGFIVTPTNEYYLKCNNKRMIAQKGCFYIPGNKSNISNFQNKSMILGDNSNLIIIKPEINRNQIIDMGFTSKVIVPKEMKEDILCLLNQLGINKKTLMLEGVNE